MLLVVCFVLFLFMVLIFFLCFLNNLNNLGKTSIFECGFSRIVNEGGTFSLPFFLISLIFLLFDVEIIILRFYPLRVFNERVLFIC